MSKTGESGDPLPGSPLPGDPGPDTSAGPPPRVRYRCGACGREFVPAAPGVASCPRCQSVDDHEVVAVLPPDGDAGAGDGGVLDGG